MAMSTDAATCGGDVLQQPAEKSPALRRAWRPGTAEQLPLAEAALAPAARGRGTWRFLFRARGGRHKRTARWYSWHGRRCGDVGDGLREGRNRGCGCNGVGCRRRHMLSRWCAGIRRLGGDHRGGLSVALGAACIPRGWAGCSPQGPGMQARQPTHCPPPAAGLAWRWVPGRRRVCPGRQQPEPGVRRGWTGCSPQGPRKQARQPTHCPPPAAGLAWRWVPGRRRVCPGRQQPEPGVRRGWTGCSPQGPRKQARQPTHCPPPAAGLAWRWVPGRRRVCPGRQQPEPGVRRGWAGCSPQGPGMQARQPTHCPPPAGGWRGGGCRDVGGFVRDGSSLSLGSPGLGWMFAPRSGDAGTAAKALPAAGGEVGVAVGAGTTSDGLSRDGSSLSLGCGRFSAGRRFADGG